MIRELRWKSLGTSIDLLQPTHGSLKGPLNAVLAAEDWTTFVTFLKVEEKNHR